MLTIDIEGEDFAVLYRQVQRFDKELAKATRKRLTEAAHPVLEDVRRAALAIPSGGSASLPIGAGTSAGLAKAMRKGRGGSVGLRKGIAGATEIKVEPSKPGKFAVRIRISDTKFEARTGKPGNLPRLMEGKGGRWRHPVWVKREDLPGKRPWASQSSHPFFVETAARHKPEVETKVKQALQDAVDTVLGPLMH